MEQLDEIETVPGPEADHYRDARIRAIVLREPVTVRRGEIIAELLPPAMWLALSLAAAWRGWHVAGLSLLCMFFLAGLRVVHKNASHHAVRLPRWADGAIIWR